MRSLILMVVKDHVGIFLFDAALLIDICPSGCPAYPPSRELQLGLRSLIDEMRAYLYKALSLSVEGEADYLICCHPSLLLIEDHISLGVESVFR